MQPRLPVLFLLIVLVVLGGSACRYLIPAALIPTPTGVYYTQAAETQAAQITAILGMTAIARMTEAAFSPTVTSTFTPSATPTPSFTPEPPTATPTQPTTTPTVPSATPVTPSPTPTPKPCNRAVFVKDISIKDGTTMTPGSEFTKIWRFRNDGSCTWKSAYYLLFVGGEFMDATKVYPFDENVYPDDVVDIAIDLVAPATPGTFRSYWMLGDPGNQLFGIGADGEKPFWTEIKVRSTNKDYHYDFAINMCLATWISNAGLLPCPGSTSDNSSVILLDKPELEDGRIENEPTLWTRPDNSRNRWIRGYYPAYKVRNNDHFVADVGCLAGSHGCKVTFILDYQISGGSVKNLGEWLEIYDKNITRINVDLSFLAGKRVNLILKVVNNSRSSQGNAFWFVPSIRGGSVPISTSTPTRTPTPYSTRHPIYTITPTP